MEGEWRFIRNFKTADAWEGKIGLKGRCTIILKIANKRGKIIGKSAGRGRVYLRTLFKLSFQLFLVYLISHAMPSRILLKYFLWIAYGLSTRITVTLYPLWPFPLADDEAVNYTDHWQDCSWLWWMPWITATRMTESAMLRDAESDPWDL